MRLFVSLDLDDKIKQEIGNITNSLRKEDIDVKWVPTDNLHITLKFLGEVSEDDVNKIENQIAEALKEVKQFKIYLEGAGFFGNKKSIRVVWIDVKGGKEKVLELMKGMDNQLEWVNENEHKPSVHLTIGRVRSNRGSELLLKKLEEMKDVKFGECKVKEIILKASELRRGGPIYSDIKVFPLE